MPVQTRPTKRGDQPQAPPEPTGELLASIPRSETEELRVSLDSLEGHPFISARVWFKDRDGEWLPTRTGVTVRVRELGQVIEALIQAAGKTGQG